MRRLLLSILLLLSGFRAASQELSYTQYTVKDGLPGTIVYQALQDRNGFIWFATSQGVSRFDGKTFKNYTKEDGLPDNEILKLYLDKYNNIWFISMSGYPSVFYKGAIRKIPHCEGVLAICEDFLSDSILFLARKLIGGKDLLDYGFYTSANLPGQWRFRGMVQPPPCDSFNWPVLRTSSDKKINYYFSLASVYDYALTIKTTGGTRTFTFPYTQQDGYVSLTMKSMLSMNKATSAIAFCTDTLFRADSNRLEVVLPLSSLHLKYVDLNTMFYENDSSVWLCSRNRGLIQIQHPFSGHPQVRSFFPKAFCTSIIKDREGGYWVTTHNEGVYYLPNLHSYYLSGIPAIADKDVKCILSINKDQLIAGFADGNILSVNPNTLQGKLFSRWHHTNNNRILDIRPYGKDKFMVISDYELHFLYPDQHSKKILSWTGLKAVYINSDSSVVTAGSEGVHEVNPYNIGGFTTIFSQRTTCITGEGNNYYWGTLNGVYAYIDKKLYNLAQKFPDLGGIINHIDIAPDSAIWVSTQQGLKILKNGRLTAIGKEQGMLSDMCKHILFDGNAAWVSTDKGISRIAYRWYHQTPVYTISNITENEGLISSDVNQTAVSGENIAVATARGICFIPRNDAADGMLSPLININAIINGNTEVIPHDTVWVDYKKNKLLIELSGISFRSGKQMYYQYRLKNLDQNWTNSATGSLEFSTLPFGTHTFEVRAVDRWGNKSEQVKRLMIVVNPPFWKTSWFIGCTYFLTAIIMGLGVYAYSRRQQLQKDKAYQFKKRMVDLEMMALKSQMNPHFIFNCLSSIQHYILRADTVNANLYLHKLSTLIRKILQLSTAADITLAEEIKILELYLSLEKLRLGERMDYKIQVEDDLQLTSLYVPAMIIQPHVENAIKHGISGLQNKQGFVQVDFRRSGNYLVCTIDDNGKGIYASAQDKKVNLPGYKPSGNLITESRINVLNTVLKDKILFEITDKAVPGLTASGTIVRLFFPISNSQL
ncbi:sensor histidine kinase [Chitinophaga nivalis]|uniref:Histidine kinase n=1 Tax=Chitinophaga nivalis TaxID=2991709 RepID=A0ABT3ILZ6_9BACT|nr:histidine kinase [Chitinophaga nivalis]MCW3465323.1 histidine kinase [Chitinophaga nivalis]MCW3484985.1 histidine kinase [Chitinophaga nivalis]